MRNEQCYITSSIEIELLITITIIIIHVENMWLLKVLRPSYI